MPDTSAASRTGGVDGVCISGAAIGLRFAGLVAVAVLAASAARAEAELAAGAVSWWFAPSTEKVFPDSRGPGDVEGLIRAARGEYESVQLVVLAEQAAERVRAAFVPSRVRAPVRVLPEEWIDVFEVCYVATPQVAKWGFAAEKQLKQYPDPLIPLRTSNGGRAFSLAAGEAKALWVRVRVPPDAEAGDYLGQLRLIGGTAQVEAPIRLQVWPFAVPTASSLRTAFGLAGRDIAARHQVTMGSEDYLRLYRRYYDEMLDYRLCAYEVPYGALDPRGREYLTQDRVNSFHAPYTGDRSRMREIWDELREFGVSRKGWVFNVDEPTSQEQYETIRDQAAYVRKAAPGLRYGVTFFAGPEWDKSRTPFDELAGSVDLWVCQTDYYHHGHGLGARVRTQMKERHKAGDQTWLYVACAPRDPFCNLLINMTALQHRLLPWQIYAEETITGLMYWRVNHWSEVDDPYTDTATVKGIDPNLYGDGMLFYPGAKAGVEGPVPSLRIELLRDGLEDYEYLLLADSILGRQVVMGLVREVTRNLTDFTTDPRAFEEVRRRLGEMIASGRPISPSQ